MRPMHGAQPAPPPTNAARNATAFLQTAQAPQDRTANGVLMELGSTLAQLGISVDSAANAGLLGGLSTADVSVLSEAHRFEQRRMLGSGISPTLHETQTGHGRVAQVFALLECCIQPFLCCCTAWCFAVPAPCLHGSPTELPPPPLGHYSLRCNNSSPHQAPSQPRSSSAARSLARLCPVRTTARATPQPPRNTLAARACPLPRQSPSACSSGAVYKNRRKLRCTRARVVPATTGTAMPAAKRRRTVSLHVP